MQVLSDAVDEQVPQVLRRVLDFLFGCVWSHHVVNLLEIFFLCKQVGHFSCIKNVVDVLKEGFVGDLDIGKNERQRSSLPPCNFCYFSQILSERFRVVTFDQLNLVLFTFHDERCQF